MIRYHVYVKKVKIGILEINEEGLHRYTPIEEGVRYVEKSVPILHDLEVKSDWREPIPFLDNRIRDASRFNSEDFIINQTDPFVLIKEKLESE